jgi:hypothetical protein
MTSLKHLGKRSSKLSGSGRHTRTSPPTGHENTKALEQVSGKRLSIFAGKQCLDAGSSSNNEEFEVNTFFPHVTFLLRNRIDDVLKVFPSDCYVDGIETRRLCSKEEENNAHDPKDAAPSVPPGCVCHPVSHFSEVNENPDTPLVQIMNWYN